ncbi:MAG TPA: alpha-1,4-glucan--maltose-1-phosphate maltosyltransferase [Planctomycetota bacterium]
MPEAPRDVAHILIEDVHPSVDAGRWPAKRIAGRPCGVEAAILRDGHVNLRAVLLWRRADVEAWSEAPFACVEPGLDRWRGEFPLAAPGAHLFAIRAWTDLYGTWLDDLRRRVESGLQVRSEALEGAALLDRVAAGASGGDAGALKAASARLKGAADRPADALAAAADPALRKVVDRLQPRDDEVTTAPLRVYADRARALVGAWYELFPRSQGAVPGRASTLREAERRFPDLKKMGFDVLYLPPIHPIGTTHRKGKNNSLTAKPGEPGSPWAIGSPAGGHDAVAPELGTLRDFDHFVAEAARHGMEIALDFALQCSPDHPWVKTHPEWFYRRPDGSIKYAENPPKKYEDIYPLNFDSEDRAGLFKEIRRVLQVWIDHGVKIFRVDNPHTKPPGFWEWLIADIQAKHPDVLFLAEAFTRPPMMKALGKLGYTQSYTYFAWRTGKAELTAYLEELSRPPASEYFRPNFFINTPDILPKILVDGGRPAFRQRLVLAATLSPSYGIYSGYELNENAAIPHQAFPDDVEYADSEKYEIRVRDWDAPGNIKDLVARLNAIRRENPALQELSNLRFLTTSDDQLLAYVKRSGGNTLLVVVNLDVHRVREGMVDVPGAAIGLDEGAPYVVRDLLTDARYPWGGRNYVRLDPAVEPAHVFRVERPS